MSSLEHGNNKDNCRGDITHKQPIGKQISYRPYKRIASLNGYFYKEDFLDWLLDLEDLFDYENICDEWKVELSEYALRQWEWIQFDRIRQDKEKLDPFMAKDEKDACYQILFFGLWWTSIIYKTRLFLTKKFTLELFWRTTYSTIKRRIVYWKTYLSWRKYRDLWEN